jgi:hypothetical protein
MAESLDPAAAPSDVHNRIDLFSLVIDAIVGGGGQRISRQLSSFCEGLQPRLAHVDYGSILDVFASGLFGTSQVKCEQRLALLCALPRTPTNRTVRDVSCPVYPGHFVVAGQLVKFLPRITTGLPSALIVRLPPWKEFGDSAA